MIGLSQKKANIIVILFLTVRLLKEGQNLFSSLLYFGPSAYDSYFFVFLLNIVEGMVNFFEGNLPADPELSHTCLLLQ